MPEHDLLRTLMDALPDALFVKDRDGRFLRANAALAAWYGLADPAEAIGKTDFDFLPADAATRARAQEQEILRTGTAAPDVVERLALPDGSERWLSTTRLPLRDRDDAIVATLGVARDITERRLADEERARLLARELAARAEAEAAQQRLAFLAEASALLAASLDYETTLQRVARLALPLLADFCTVDMVDDDGRIHGVAVAHIDPDRERLLHEIRRRFPPHPTATQPQYQVIRSGKTMLLPELSDERLAEFHPLPGHMELVLQLDPRSGISAALIARGKTLGALTFGRGSGRPRFTENEFALAEEIARRAATAIDNALLYREAQALNLELEQRVANRTAELQAANKELETFAYSVSHDLRAPLRAMDGFARILLEHHAAPLDAQGRRYLQLVRDNAQQMGRLIDDLLRFSRLGRQAMTRRRVAPAEVVRQAWDTLQADLEGRQVRLVIGDLPECEADVALLRQVFANLLSNALKFTRGREEAVVEVGSLDDAGQTAYYVRDNGVGFSMQYAHKLFGIFQRLHRAEEYEGTGVGLALVQRIIVRHGGRIWADAIPNQGATFYFTLGSGSGNE